MTDADHRVPQPAQMVFRRPRAEGRQPRRSQRGEALGLVGDNGAGKSTLIKILSGVHRPDQGEILIEGKPVASRTPQRRDAISASRRSTSTIRWSRPCRSPATCSSAASRCSSRIGGIGMLDQKQMRERKHPGDRRCRPASALARRAGRRAVRRPAAGRRHRARHAFQVEGADPRRADQSSLGQGDEQGDRLRARPEGAGRHRHLHQPQHAPRLRVLRPGRRDGARRDRVRQARSRTPRSTKSTAFL